MMALELFEELWEAGYSFVSDSYSGEYEVEDWEEVVDEVEGVEESEWQSLEFEVDEESRIVRYCVEDDE